MKLSNSKKYLWMLIVPVMLVGMITIVKAEANGGDQENSSEPGSSCMCTMQYDPVCGEDGKTYSNACHAECADIKIAHKGKCEKEGTKESGTSDKCSWVSVNCCPANAGAQWECVNSREYELDCSSKEDLVCPQVISPKPDKVCQSTSEGCQVGTTSEEVVSEGDQDKKDKNISRIKERAHKLFSGEVESILEDIGEKVPEEAQQGVQTAQDKIKQARQRAQQHLGEMEQKMKKMNEQARQAINTFVGYGVDENTKGLGAGERAAVVHSFNKAFNKLPETEEEVEDMVKIANGRWPSAHSQEAEEQAKKKFMDIYDRIPSMDNPKDEAAVTIMAYGLRQRAENRSLNSEKKGVQIFKRIFGHSPQDTQEWNVMQAITYSGAKKMEDSDGDKLPDVKEEQIGTDPEVADSDEDGYMDGIEVGCGLDPLKAEKVILKDCIFQE